MRPRRGHDPCQLPLTQGWLCEAEEQLRQAGESVKGAKQRCSAHLLQGEQCLPSPPEGLWRNLIRDLTSLQQGPLQSSATAYDRCVAA